MNQTHEIIIAGFGGQGVLSLGQMLAYAGMSEGKEVSWLPSYGPEMRGGTANCNVIISTEPIGAPLVTAASCLIAMNRPSLEKFEKDVKPGGLVLVNSSLIDIKCSRADVNAVYIPCNEIATELGNARVANMVMLGAYLALAQAVTPESVLAALPAVLGADKTRFIPINREAMLKGEEFVSK